MEHILTTKLYIPHTRPELVSRPRLITWLHAGVHRKLTLISAPAGFGKTTLVSEWVGNIGLDTANEKESGNRVAWLSLDESDNDLACFLSYIIAALNRVEGIESSLGSNLLGMLQSPQPPPTETLLIALINDIATNADRIILVLDDYHIIESSSVDNALTFLLEHLPPQLHLVIATRFDPHLPLARLRAKSQLTELRAADLRFTTTEATHFLNQAMGLSLSAENIAVLENRTEGWITGLQLAAISLQSHKDIPGLINSFSGSHRFVLDYLIEEVLEQQPKPLQAFLLQTAILERLTASLCDALTEQSNGQATLEMLEHANLFIVSLDDERRWYRYHHLFADLLLQRLHQAQPDAIPTLHQRASMWYEQHGFPDEAIEHALRAKDYAGAAGLIERVAESVWGHGEHTRLRRWLDRLPTEVIFTKPDLCLFHAWILFASGQQDAAEQSLQAAEQRQDVDRDNKTATDTKVQPASIDRRKRQGRIAAIRAFLASFRGNVSGMIQHARQALDCLPVEDVTWRSTASIALGDAYTLTGEIGAAYQARLDAIKTSKAAGNIYMILIANIKLAITLRQQGQLQRSIATCQQQLEFAHESGLSQTSTAGCFLAIWGEALAELNELDEALHQVRKGVALAEPGMDVATLGWGYLCLIRVFFSRGDMASAQEIITKVENIDRELDIPPWVKTVMARWQVRVWLAQEKLDTAAQWATEQGLNPDDSPTFVVALEHIALARILLAQGRLAETIALLQRLLDSAEMWGQTTRMIETLLLQALAFHAAGDTDQAMTPLARALALAKPGCYIRIFVDEGPPMAQLLYEAAARGIEQSYTRRLLAAFPIVETEHTDLSNMQASPSELFEPLSSREQEILHCIAEGLTNQEISSKLVLSPHTVKAHTRSIYGKLDVHNRTQAVARARGLGILSSS